ncbi:hypothetical protein Q0M04_14470, partial [Staphylococcus aureus]|nr:hypothetical protein [Staphylococcus aureus]
DFKDLSESYNLNLDFITDIMKKESLNNISEERWNMFNAFCLRLIQAFDHVEHVEYLYIAQDILERLEATDVEKEFIRNINLLQIKYRINNR